MSKIIKNMPKLLSMIVLIIFLFPCSAFAQNYKLSSITTNNSSTSIQVTGTYPASNTQLCGIDYSIILQFSSHLGKSDISKIHLVDGNGTAVTGLSAEIYSADDTILIIKHNRFSYYTKYTLNLDAGAVADSGNTISSGSFTLNFQTADEFNRFSGADRYVTSAAISKMGWAKSTNVILCNGDKFPDALCAGPFAYEKNAPILLTSSDNLINSVVLGEIQRLNAKNIYIIGGTGAVSQSIEDNLKKNYTVTRIAGKDRYETSYKIAALLKNDSKKAFIATGNNFPDALSVASLASAYDIPILLTNNDVLNTNANKYINDNKITQTFVIGGNGVISDKIKGQLPANTERISGADRYATNLEVINRFKSDVYTNLDTEFTMIATGEDFPDALAGAAFCAYTYSPIILVNDNMDQKYIDTLRNMRSTMVHKFIYGGESAVSNNILKKIFN